MCWLMDGTFHKLDESLDDHPNGRCTQIPKVKGMPLPLRGTGVEAFEKLSDVQKLKVLGPAKYAAYRAGDLKLKQLIGVKRSGEWGRMFYERSLKEIGKDAKYWLGKYAENPVPKIRTVDEVVSEVLDIFEKSGREGASVSFYHGNVFGRPFYAVSPYPDLTKPIIGNNVNPDDVKKYIESYRGLLKDEKNVVGLWYDKSSDVTYLDITALIEDEKVAIKIGKQ